MIFTLEVRRARKGDCLLLHYGSAADRGLILIDGGPSRVYEPHLKPRLEAIRAARGLTASQPLTVDLMMVSHVDDDHINGILELTGELVQAKDARQPLPLKIRSFWHNTFDDIIGKNPAELRAAVTAAFGAASLSGDPDVDGLDPSTAKVLASIGQGIRLRDDARKLSLRMNPEFDGRLVMATADGAPVSVGKGLSFIVAGPMKPEIAALQKDHDEFLKKEKAERNKASLASFTDTSVPNLSSIVVLADAGGKRVLLTGDARGDKIIEGLELVKALKPRATLHVDVLKMPHHGSDRNMERSFLERIVADHYVFSGDGEHGNPERATLDMLRQARAGAKYAIHLTYPIAEIDEKRKADWAEERRKELARKKTNPATKVRAEWSAAAHGLTAFFAAHADMAARVRIVDARAPHVIDLLDPVAL